MSPLISTISSHVPYTGTDAVIIGNDSALPISHIGFLTFSSHFKLITLSDALYVPNIHKNLILVSQLCKTNNVSIKFFDLCFLMKDQLMGIVLMCGLNKEGVYEWPLISILNKSPMVFASNLTSATTWHQRLGHRSSRILDYLLNKNTLL